MANAPLESISSYLDVIAQLSDESANCNVSTSKVHQVLNPDRILKEDADLCNSDRHELILEKCSILWNEAKNCLDDSELIQDYRLISDFQRRYYELLNNVQSNDVNNFGPLSTDVSCLSDDLSNELRFQSILKLRLVAIESVMNQLELRRQLFQKQENQHKNFSANLNHPQLVNKTTLLRSKGNANIDLQCVSSVQYRRWFLKARLTFDKIKEDTLEARGDEVLLGLIKSNQQAFQQNLEIEGQLKVQGFQRSDSYDTIKRYFYDLWLDSLQNLQLIDQFLNEVFNEQQTNHTLGLNSSLAGISENNGESEYGPMKKKKCHHPEKYSTSIIMPNDEKQLFHQSDDAKLEHDETNSSDDINSLPPTFAPRNLSGDEQSSVNRVNFVQHTPDFTTSTPKFTDKALHEVGISGDQPTKIVVKPQLPPPLVQNQTIDRSQQQRRCKRPWAIADKGTPLWTPAYQPDGYSLPQIQLNKQQDQQDQHNVCTSTPNLRSNQTYRNNANTNNNNSGSDVMRRSYYRTVPLDEWGVTDIEELTDDDNNIDQNLLPDEDRDDGADSGTFLSYDMLSAGTNSSLCETNAFVPSPGDDRPRSGCGCDRCCCNETTVGNGLIPGANGIGQATKLSDSMIVHIERTDDGLDRDNPFTSKNASPVKQHSPASIYLASDDKIVDRADKMLFSQDLQEVMRILDNSDIDDPVTQSDLDAGRKIRYKQKYQGKKKKGNKNQAKNKFQISTQSQIGATIFTDSKQQPSEMHHKNNNNKKREQKKVRRRSSKTNKQKWSQKFYHHSQKSRYQGSNNESEDDDDCCSTTSTANSSASSRSSYTSDFFCEDSFLDFIVTSAQPSSASSLLHPSASVPNELMNCINASAIIPTKTTLAITEDNARCFGNKQGKANLKLTIDNLFLNLIPVFKGGNTDGQNEKQHSEFGRTNDNAAAKAGTQATLISAGLDRANTSLDELRTAFETLFHCLAILEDKIDGLAASQLKQQNSPNKRKRQSRLMKKQQKVSSLFESELWECCERMNSLETMCNRLAELAAAGHNDPRPSHFSSSEEFECFHSVLTKMVARFGDKLDQIRQALTGGQSRHGSHQRPDQYQLLSPRSSEHYPFCRFSLPPRLSNRLANNHNTNCRKQAHSHYGRAVLTVRHGRFVRVAACRPITSAKRHRNPRHNAGSFTLMAAHGNNPNDDDCGNNNFRHRKMNVALFSSDDLDVINKTSGLDALLGANGVMGGTNRQGAGHLPSVSKNLVSSLSGANHPSVIARNQTESVVSNVGVHVLGVAGAELSTAQSVSVTTATKQTSLKGGAAASTTGQTTVASMHSLSSDPSTSTALTPTEKDPNCPVPKNSNTANRGTRHRAVLLATIAGAVSIALGIFVALLSASNRSTDIGCLGQQFLASVGAGNGNNDVDWRCRFGPQLDYVDGPPPF